MKGVILAGGTGSRMGELCRATNKHLLPVGRQPMLCHPLRKLVAAGIADVLVVTSPDGVGQLGRLLGSGSRHSCRISFRVQDEPGGIAQALALAEDFVGDDCCAVILGDNVWHAPFPALFDDPDRRAWVALSRVPDPWRYGVATLDADSGRVTKITEKPSEPDSNLAVVGIYAYPPSVFGVIRTLKPSGRGELEITDLNNHYLRAGLLECVTLPGWWIDAGEPEGLDLANRLVREQPPLW